MLIGKKSELKEKPCAKSPTPTPSNPKKKKNK